MSLAEIQNRIAAAEVAHGRPKGQVKMIAVSKVQSNARVEKVLAQGQRIFGENRVQGSSWAGASGDVQRH